MKKVKLLTLIGVLFSNCVTAQVSIPANAGIATDYVGWDNTNGFRLPIKHEGTWPIDFYKCWV